MKIPSALLVSLFIYLDFAAHWSQRHFVVLKKDRANEHMQKYSGCDIELTQKVKRNFVWGRRQSLRLGGKKSAVPARTLKKCALKLGIGTLAALQ